MDQNLQQKLSAEQIAEFYHDVFVRDQTTDFAKMVGLPVDSGVVVDIGGGVGYFAERVSSELGYPVRVVDMDPESIVQCTARSVPAQLGDALAPPITGDEACVCFNLILHHLVAENEAKTRSLQVRALSVWKDRNVPIFVNEYIYESFISRLSGKLIYLITSSKLLSKLAGMAAKVVPAFRANTFGVGVRFRSHDEWIELFREAGFVAERTQTGTNESISPPLRLLMIKTIRRDSFLLRRAPMPAL
jgi:hypothetical protein